MLKTIVLLSTIVLTISTIHAEEIATKSIEGTSHVSPNYTKMLKKAQKIFKKKLQKKCGYNAAYFAQLHTQDEWEVFKTVDKFKKEFGVLCPKGEKLLKEKWIKPLYLWSKEYAKDSLYRPMCSNMKDINLS